VTDVICSDSMALQFVLCIVNCVLSVVSKCTTSQKVLKLKMREHKREFKLARGGNAIWLRIVTGGGLLCIR
jgi:hypothetical protein